MPAQNPYAPSRASLEVADKPVRGAGIWRYGKSVILAQGHAFPQRCVKCNEPSVQPHREQKVYWHHPALYVLLLIWVIVYLVVALAVRKTAKIDPGLCEQHRRERRKWITIGWVGSLAGLFVFPMAAFAVGLETLPAMSLTILCVLGIVVLAIVKSRVLYPQRIDDQYARLRGADERFLASLPEF